jgi:cardiolipin synthase (CMP-forming)
MHSVFGTILDPAADKVLMTTLAITLTMKGLVPCASLPVLFSSLCVLILAASLFLFFFSSFGSKYR